MSALPSPNKIRASHERGSNILMTFCLMVFDLQIFLYETKLLLIKLAEITRPHHCLHRDRACAWAGGWGVRATLAGPWTYLMSPTRRRGLRASRVDVKSERRFVRPPNMAVAGGTTRHLQRLNNGRN